MTSTESDKVRIVLTPIKIVRDSVTGLWSTPKSRNNSMEKVKYNLRVRTPSTPVVSLSSPVAKQETSYTSKSLTRASRQISFDEDHDEYEQDQSWSSDEDGDNDDDDEEGEEDDEEDEDDEDGDYNKSLLSDDEKFVSTNNHSRKSTLNDKSTLITKRIRSTMLPRVNDRFNRFACISLKSFLDEYNNII